MKNHKEIRVDHTDVAVLVDVVAVQESQDPHKIHLSKGTINIQNHHRHKNMKKISASHR